MDHGVEARKEGKKPKVWKPASEDRGGNHQEDLPFSGFFREASPLDSDSSTVPTLLSTFKIISITPYHHFDRTPRGWHSCK